MNNIKKLLKNKYFGIFMRLLITALMFFWISKMVDWKKFIPLLFSLPLYSLVAVLFSVFMVIVFCIIRWKILLSAIDKKVNWFFLIKGYWIGFFMNNFLPASVGMDIVRAAYISDDKEETAKILGTTIVERLLGFLGIFVFTLVAIIFLFIIKVDIPYIGYGFVFSLIDIAILVLFFYIFYHPRIYKLLSSWFEKIKFMNIGNLLNRIYDAFIYYKDKPKAVFYNILISSCIQGTLILGIYFIGKGIGVTIPITHYLLYVPLIMIISTLPLTINGVGLRELSFIYLFGLSGVSSEQALLISLIFFFSTIAVSLPGGLFILFDRK